MPSILATLQENVRAIRAVLDRAKGITIPSHAASPIIRVHLLSATPSSSAAAKAPSFDVACEGRLLQDTVDEALA